MNGFNHNNFQYFIRGSPIRKAFNLFSNSVSCIFLVFFAVIISLLVSATYTRCSFGVLQLYANFKMEAKHKLI